MIGWAERRAGGRAWLVVIATLAAVLSLDAADKGAVGASATQLQETFGVGPTALGFLLTATGLVTAAATIPMGALVDRVERRRLLVVTMLVWSASMGAAALAPTYTVLLLARLLLGGAAAVAYPAVSSLIGDWFPEEHRARVLGLVLAGELVGTGAGLALTAVATAMVSWRAGFGLVGLAGLGAARAVQRLPEPARAGGDRLVVGQHDLRRPGAPDAADRPHAGDPRLTDERPGLWAVARYVLGTRTNVALIVSSALGYYMFAGLRTFGLEFARTGYGIATATALGIAAIGGLAALAGVVTGGQVADRLLDRGRRDARITVPATSYLLMTAALVPGVVTGSVVVAAPLLVTAAFFLAAANPPLDAARLDVIPAPMWGRAEAVRTVARTVLEAVAPLLFGATAEYLIGGDRGDRLRGAILVMVAPLLASPLVLLLARHSYPADADRARRRNDDGPAGPATLRPPDRAQRPEP